MAQKRIDPAARKDIEASARKDIEAGNQAWVDGMKAGSMAGVVATYEDDAVDCSPAGECVTGRDAIAQFMNERIAKLGKATSALVTSAGSVQQGDFVYEWGRARAEFSRHRSVAGRYLTAWRRQPDGSWKIFRNISIPADRAR
ncbi:MAG TPA: DUF4440 domain-containing protein [Terriglobales bacterium]|nr:DUF4440 domain-containing protein [Terriglobales bacterium]